MAGGRLSGGARPAQAMKEAVAVAQLQPVRGTHDILPEEMRRQQAVAATARDWAARYGFDEIATPIFEFTDVFRRTLGDASDIVQKEMYTFTDKNGEELTLRPEGTAGAARAFISNGWRQSAPVKAFYTGPMFRHERPQKGRLRQFHQVGVELMGADHPMADVETILLGQDILAALGLGESVRLELNTLGDRESRAAYRDALRAFFHERRDALSAESRARLERNPLRILDSKDPADQAVVAEAPTFDAYLSQPAADFFARVCAGLDAHGITYVRNPYLVRGLDYYTHTAFEFTTDKLGAQGTVLAGGRYDGLVEQMGGPPTPGIGWAAGIERLAMLAELGTLAPQRPVALILMGTAAEDYGFPLARRLRQAGLRVEVPYTGNLKRRLQKANRMAARAAVILGDEELAAGRATLRDLDTGAQEAVPVESLVERLMGLGPAGAAA